jgi:hypothetical protein
MDNPGPPALPTAFRLRPQVAAPERAPGPVRHKSLARTGLSIRPGDHPPPRPAGGVSPERDVSGLIAAAAAQALRGR